MLFASKIICILFLLLTADWLKAKEEVPYDFTWLDSEKKIFVIQNKIYEKELSFYVDLAAGDHSHSNFQSSIVFQSRLGMFITENWGFEFFYSVINNRNNEAVNALKNIRETKSGDGNIINPFVRQINKYYGVALVYSPFYAKVSAWSSTYYFDLNLAFGLEKIIGASNIDDFMTIPPDPSNRFNPESYFGPLIRAELRFYVTRRFTISPTFSQSWFTAELPTTPARPTGTVSYSEITLSFGVNL